MRVCGWLLTRARVCVGAVATCHPACVCGWVSVPASLRRHRHRRCPPPQRMPQRGTPATHPHDHLPTAACRRVRGRHTRAAACEPARSTPGVVVCLGGQHPHSGQLQSGGGTRAAVAAVGAPRCCTATVYSVSEVVVGTDTEVWHVTPVSTSPATTPAVAAAVVTVTVTRRRRLCKQGSLRCGGTLTRAVPTPTHPTRLSCACHQAHRRGDARVGAPGSGTSTVVGVVACGGRDTHSVVSLHTQTDTLSSMPTRTPTTGGVGRCSRCCADGSTTPVPPPRGSHSLSAGAMVARWVWV